MSLIPITIHVSFATLEKLESAAVKRGTHVRLMIVDDLEAGLDPQPYSRVITRKKRPVRREDVDAWIEAVQMDVTNSVIAERWGVPEQLVSRCLNARGIYRHKPHERRQTDEQEAPDA
jgi:hypothetical protein